jgi:hypothetical protein
MLVVTANWAIPDGSVAAPPRAAQFARLCDDIRLAAMRAGMRRDGRYRPLARLVIVLAGDTLDGLVSGRWGDDVRPWERGRRALARHEEVLVAAARSARRPLAALARLARGGVAVPSADRRGRPVMTGRIVVPVHLVMLAGDRDRALERLRGRGWSERRGIGVGTIWEGDRWCVAHGSACDPLAAGEDGPTLLASLAVDLLARFGAALAARPGVAEYGRSIVRVLADGQPLDMPLRLATMLRSIAVNGVEVARITTEWRRCVDRWDREARRTGCEDGHGEVAAIAAWMHAIEGTAAPGPPVRAVIAALSGPLPPAASRLHGNRPTVLGHPASMGDDAERAVVCLGAPAMRPCPGPAFAREIAGRAACVEAMPAISPTGLPAVAVPEADEGGVMRAAWWPMWDVGSSPGCRPEAMPILDAA